MRYGITSFPLIVCLLVRMNQALCAYQTTPTQSTLLGSFCKSFVMFGPPHSSDKAVQKAEHEWICDQPKPFFSHGIHKLVDRWNMCIEVGEHYEEKWRLFFVFCVFPNSKNNKSADDVWFTLVRKHQISTLFFRLKTDSRSTFTIQFLQCRY